MIAADVIDRVKAVIGRCDEQTVFEYLSDAVEVLSNKGNLDPLVCYIDVPTVNGNELVLPDFVDDVLKVNINRKPAFARGRLFEFRQNTDGTVIGDELGYTWADRGDKPVQVDPVGTFQLKASENNAVRIYGLDSDGKPVYTNGEEGYTATTTLAGPTWSKIMAVKKFSTTGYVNLFAGTTQIASYEPKNYEPNFRVIKVSKSASAVRMLVRRKTYVISSPYDWIPINSRIAITYMVKSLVLGRKQSDVKEVQYYEKQATQYLLEKQNSHNAHSKMSDETEVITVRNQTYETSDCVTVGQIYDKASDIFGGIGREKLFDRISDAISILTNESTWDGLTAWLDVAASKVMADGSKEFTLPNWVETVLKVNINGLPTTGYNKWFQFHRNGPGQYCQFTNSWQDRGDYPTIRDITAPAALVASIDTTMDDNVQIRVYGLDSDGNEIYTDGQRGMVIPAIYGSILPDPNLPKVSKVTRIVKDQSVGYVRIIAYEDGATAEKLIGQMRPEDTENTYRRIQVSTKSENIRMLVRKKTYRVSSLCDSIPLYDRNSLVAAMQAKNALDSGDTKAAVDFREIALQLLEAEQEKRNPLIEPSIEIDPTMAPGSVLSIR